jgi:hypothetical protein
MKKKGDGEDEKQLRVWAQACDIRDDGTGTFFALGLRSRNRSSSPVGLSNSIALDVEGSSWGECSLHICCLSPHTHWIKCDLFKDGRSLVYSIKIYIMSIGVYFEKVEDHLPEEGELSELQALVAIKERNISHYQPEKIDYWKQTPLTCDQLFAARSRI